MSNQSIIKTTKTIYPQIYAYTLPNVKENNGWIKIGYTERYNVDQRIKEQTKTAAINLTYSKLWSEPAKFNNSDEWFKDKQFHDYLRKHKNIQQRPNTEWFFYNGTPEKSHNDFEDFCNMQLISINEGVNYKLRDEQKLAVNKTLEYAQNNHKGEFLWNAKPRFGKTLTTYDFIRKLNAMNVLIVTNRPAIANSWFDDFEKFIAWQTDYKFVSTSESLKDRPVLTRDEFLKNLNDNSRQIAFISLQDLKGAIAFGGNYNKLSWVKGLNWDLLVVDESHEGIDTLKTDIAFNEINRKFTLHLSGTPFKEISSGKFLDEQIYNWTYSDEQKAKRDWPTSSEENNPYEKLPRLNMLSYQMSQMITDKVNQGAEVNGENIDYAFDLNEFFETNDSGRFIYENDVSKWLDSLTQNEKYPFSTKELRAELKHTFWLLNRVASAKALEKLIKIHPVLKEYEVILAAGDGRSNDDDQIINEKSLERVRKAIGNNDKTITLSVGQLTTGVTIPEWTAVFILSNMKSPSLYMQAAFRAQNPWSYEIDGQILQKENAYVFDFAPERTLIMYDEFANNLNHKTARGGGTTSDRRHNIKTLLNFFPVIAEDRNGRMVELDEEQVLTIPKTIKAKEVVRRGFMSNLLFQNISGIFSSVEAREILDQLNPVDLGKTVPRKVNDPIDTKNVQLSDDNEVKVDQEKIVNVTKAYFGPKVYTDAQSTINSVDNVMEDSLPEKIADLFKDSTVTAIKKIAKDNNVSVKSAEQVIERNKKIIAREIAVIQKIAKIKKAEIEIEYKNEISVSHNDPIKLAEAKRNYETKEIEIAENLEREIKTNYKKNCDLLTKKSTENILKQSENKKRNIVEDDVRARLRGFARTIPLFLMAYGEDTTTLENFETIVENSIFREVTGIGIDQFCMLRDEYKFFDTVVFNESAQEFLKKRTELANYFDENQEEDIFDYIPPQFTNQIFTPKKIVIMMVDKLQTENPEIFNNPNKTFVDLYMKSGLYITEIVKRLYVGLENTIPDEKARLKHILENQVYGFAPSEIIHRISERFIFGFDEKIRDIKKSHIVYLDTEPFARGEGDFDAKCNELFGGNLNEV